MHPLDGVNAKIARADDHIKSVMEEMQKFLARKPYDISSTFDATAQCHRFFSDQRMEIPTIIPVLIGEVVANLRSALDHMVWQLALLNTKSPQVATEFPVYSHLDKYTSNRKRKIGDLSPAAKAIIDESQPLRAAKPFEDPLWRLHLFNNIDKHRLLHVVAAVPSGCDLGPLGAPSPFDATMRVRLNYLEGRAEFATAWVKIPCPEAVPLAKFNIELAVDLVGDRHILFIAKLLDSFRARVATLVQAFTHFFPKP